ncbi:MAG: methylated-DNA--[protein]-cysteine S-methyltransferase [Cycloclasticus sp.]|nr:methylated-DNA--[protein]-cysteine S-methyltransferase [Cycloclasticus sp.]
MRVNPKHQKIWMVVKNILKGLVSTYGDVARCAGFPRGARMVGVALRAAPDELNVPCYRVINAKGQLSFSTGHEKELAQRERLEKEGVVFSSGIVNLKKYAWKVDQDREFWQM